MDICNHCGRDSVLFSHYELALELHFEEIEMKARFLRDRGWTPSESYSCAEFEVGAAPRLEDCPRECDCGV